MSTVRDFYIFLDEIAPFAAQLSMDLAAAGIAVKPELDAETLAEEVCQLK